MGLELPPGRQVATDVALGQFEQERPQRFLDLVECLDADGVERGESAAGQNLVESVQALEGVLFVGAQVAERVEGDSRVVTPIGQHSQGGLLGHDPRGQEQGPLLAEQLRHVAFELLDHAAVTVDVEGRVGRNLLEQRGGAARSVAAEEAVALGGESGERGQ